MARGTLKTNNKTKQTTGMDYDYVKGERNPKSQCSVLLALTTNL